jgi:hypothetical protein
LSVPFGGGSATVRAEWAEEDVVVFGDNIKRWFTLEFEDEILFDLL